MRTAIREKSMHRTPLLARIEAHLKRSGLSATRFGRLTARDPRLVWDLRAGRWPRRALERRVLAWIEAREAEEGGGRCGR
jgi:hypothetical protein